MSCRNPTSTDAAPGGLDERDLTANPIPTPRNTSAAPNISNRHGESPHGPRPPPPSPSSASSTGGEGESARGSVAIAMARQPTGHDPRATGAQNDRRPE